MRFDIRLVRTRLARINVPLRRRKHARQFRATPFALAACGVSRQARDEFGDLVHEAGDIVGGVVHRGDSRTPSRRGLPTRTGAVRGAATVRRVLLRAALPQSQCGSMTMVENLPTATACSIVAAASICARFSSRRAPAPASERGARAGGGVFRMTSSFYLLQPIQQPSPRHRNGDGAGASPPTSGPLQVVYARSSIVISLTSVPVRDTKVARDGRPQTRKRLGERSGGPARARERISEGNVEIRPSPRGSYPPLLAGWPCGWPSLGRVGSRRVALGRSRGGPQTRRSGRLGAVSPHGGGGGIRTRKAEAGGF